MDHRLLIAMNNFQMNLQLELSVRRIETYPCTDADRKLRRKLKRQRGLACEACQSSLPIEQLFAHHIFQTRIHPELAREPLNMIVLCTSCHSSVSNAEKIAGSAAIHFYSRLPVEVRRRHVPYVESKAHASSALISALRRGDELYWNDRAVRDLTK